MSEFVDVAGKDEVPEGGMIKVSAGSRDYLVARVSGKYYCADRFCPHLGGDLSGGVLFGTVILCPIHHSRFDLADGHVVQWAGGLLGKIRAPKPLNTYEVRVDGDRVRIKV